MATKAQIQVSVTGFKQLQNLQASVKAVVPQIDKANAAFIRLTGASKQTLPIIANLRTELEKSKKAFQGSVLGTQAATTAAKTLANAERLVNNELSRRNALLNKARGLRVSAVDKSIARNQRRRPKRDSSSGFASFSRDADEIGLQGQSSPVGGKIQRTIAIKQDEIRLQQALLSLEQKSAAVLNEKLQIQGEVNRQTALEVEKKLLRGQSSPLTSDIRGNIGDIKSRREANILSERKNQFSNVNPGAGGFRSFSARASEIQNATKAEIALAKSRRALIQKTNSLISIERKRAQTESFGANLRRFRRGRTSADRAVRERVASNALIGGAFPLLFGQGGAASAGGALGGAAGGLLGGQFGFALSLVGTQLGSIVDNLISGAAELGQAIGSFAQDTQAVATAIGLQNSAEQARLTLIEEVQGKTAAFNASMKLLRKEVGEGGVRALQRFGETQRIINRTFATLGTNLQSVAARIVNFVLEITGIEKELDLAEAQRIVQNQAILTGDPKAKQLAKDIQETKRAPREGSLAVGGIVGLIPGTDKANLAEKAKVTDEAVLQFAQEVKINNALDLRFKTLTSMATAKEDELNLNERINELSKTHNKELATELAKINQKFDKKKQILESEINELKFKKEKGELDNNEITELDQKVKFLLKIDDLEEDLIENAIRLFNATSDIKSNFELIGESIASGVSDNLTAAIQGTKTLGDAAKSILNDLSSSLIRLGVNTLLSKIPGFGGLPSLLPRANGGPVKKGGSFVVGEKGPELFVPKRSGTIIPNDKLAGGGSTNISVNVDASGSSVQSNEQQGKELGRVISAAIQSELIKQRRPGGLLR